jgi:hypothetical protein
MNIRKFIALTLLSSMLISSMPIMAAVDSAQSQTEKSYIQKIKKIAIGVGGAIAGIITCIVLYRFLKNSSADQKQPENPIINPPSTCYGAFPAPDNQNVPATQPQQAAPVADPNANPAPAANPAQAPAPIEPNNNQANPAQNQAQPQALIDQNIPQFLNVVEQEIQRHQAEQDEIHRRYNQLLQAQLDAQLAQQNNPAPAVDNAVIQADEENQIFFEEEREEQIAPVQGALVDNPANQAELARLDAAEAAIVAEQDQELAQFRQILPLIDQIGQDLNARFIRNEVALQADQQAPPAIPAMQVQEVEQPQAPEAERINQDINHEEVRRVRLARFQRQNNAVIAQS